MEFINTYLTATTTSSFGKDGFTNTPLEYFPTCLVVQQDNKIVEGGIVNGNYTILLRLNPDGTVDSTFGTNGTFTDFTFKYQHPYDVKQQADGKLVVCGYYIENVFSGIIYSLITRVNADGTLDKSFGEAGHAIEKSELFPAAYSMAIQPDGKIVCSADEPYGPKLIRYNTNGTLDSSFGENGLVTTRFSKYGDNFKDVEIQADGKIVAAGTAQDDAINGKQPYIAVARYNTDGSLDESFGIGGKAVINYEDIYTKGTSLVVQPNGKIVVSGKTFILGTYYDICVSRLLPDGTLDSSFGFNGKMVTAIENSGEESYQVGLQTDGKIIVTSSSVEMGHAKIVLARYHGDPVATNPLITRINSWIQDNLLGWYSTNSSSVNYYSIQYSKNGSSFTEVKRVPAEKLSAAGREPSANAYRYVLATAPTDSYYRIAAIQQDGSKAYSEVVYYPGSKSASKPVPQPG